jgi:hypothetical protein
VHRPIRPERPPSRPVDGRTVAAAAQSELSAVGGGSVKIKRAKVARSNVH